MPALKKYYLFFLLLLSSISKNFAQDSIEERKPIDSVYVTVSKWPFFGPQVPPHLAIIGGLDGFNSPSFSIGIFHSIAPITNSADIGTGAQAGYGFYYRQNLNNPKIYSTEMEIGVFAGI